MHLLEFGDHDELRLTTFINDIPPYAILSHTWGADDEEVTFYDIKNRSDKSKVGYQKIEFCGQQARKDGLQYFWVDTCCIDKSSSAELSEAITSMFRWYADAANCYVYLSDVFAANKDKDQLKSAFQGSRWFTRGWTLQELLAPSNIEFFSSDRVRLGDKTTLEAQLHEITQIPIAAFRGKPLSTFTVDERLRWADKRQTKRKEDMAYCLLGIFGVYMYILYGEGENAFVRLKEEVERSSEKKLTSIPRDIFPNKADHLSEEGKYAKTKEDCLKSLSFPTIDDRQNTITKAHRKTCNWLFRTTEFKEWLKRTNLSEHNGVLWIKGKPGSGKSTLMKHVLDHCRATKNFGIIATFFFNARGSELEQNPLGMMRSLLYQLMDQLPDMFGHFSPLFQDKLKKHGNPWNWHIGELEEFLVSEMLVLQSKPMLIIIDALDECSEKEVRSVVSLIEQLSVTAKNSKNTLRICLSSRHYPTISMRKNLSLTLEDQLGHDRDINLYVTSKLKATDSEIKIDLCSKANHVFMWVVLVVEMLNIAYDEGRERAVRKKLDEVPGDLEEVYQTLLDKDNRHKEETLLLLQWTLFARELMSPEELFSAVLAGISPEQSEPWDQSKENIGTIKRYITSTSRGLVEVCSGYRQQNVQFIHLSVKDFLLRNKRLARMDPMLEEKTIARCHDRLAACCFSSIRSGISSSSYTRESPKFPFLGYALKHVLEHAEIAQMESISQRALLEWLSQSEVGAYVLKRILNRLDRRDDSTQSDRILLLPFLSFRRLHALMFFCLDLGADINGEDEVYGSALTAASGLGYLKNVTHLVERGADVNTGDGAALVAASLHRRWEVVKFLVERGADVNVQNGWPLAQASQHGQLEVVKFLVERGADVNFQNGGALAAASLFCQWKVVKFLVERGADVNVQNGAALAAASLHGQWEVVKFLVERGAVVNVRDGVTLWRASVHDQWELVKFLVDEGAEVDARDGAVLRLALGSSDPNAVHFLQQAAAKEC